MNEKYSDYSALHFGVEGVIKSSEGFPRFAECCNIETFALSTAPDPPTTMQNLLADSTPFREEFRNNTRPYKTSLAMGYVKAAWTSRGPGIFTSNPTMTLHRRIYPYLGAVVSPTTSFQRFLSVFIHDTD